MQWRITQGKNKSRAAGCLHPTCDAMAWIFRSWTDDESKPQVWNPNLISKIINSQVDECGRLPLGGCYGGLRVLFALSQLELLFFCIPMTRKGNKILMPGCDNIDLLSAATEQEPQLLLMPFVGNCLMLQATHLYTIVWATWNYSKAI